MTTAELTFSLVVNTIDRAGPLRTLLRALEHQSYSHFEVIAVVGPTRDETLDVLSEYVGRVRVLRCPTANLSRSRNIGLVAARGDVVAFIDDDAVPSVRWLEQIARLFQNALLDATGGAVFAIHPEFSNVQFRIGIYSSLSEQLDVRSSWVDQIIPPGRSSHWIVRTMGTNMAFRRRALLDIGGFDEFYEYVADETDVEFRLTNAGKNIYPVQEAVVYHIPASSRNRQMFSHRGRYWLRSRSRVYFGIRNGIAAGDPLARIALRSLFSVGAHWLWYGGLRRTGQLAFLEALVLHAKEFRSGVSGTFNALFRPRRLIAPASIAARRNTVEPIEPFQNDNSMKQPTVDPVTGYQSSISMPDPPLRICLLSGRYPPAQFDGIGRLTNLMARGLFECGHTVHVIVNGERDRVSFYDGAYVHQVACRLERYSRYERFHNLFYALNYSHSVFNKVRRLMLNDGIQIVDSPLWQFEGLVTLTSGIAPVVVRLVTGIRQLAEIHNRRMEEVELMGDLEQELVKRADHVIPNTRATLETVREIYQVHIDETRSTIVPYGIIPSPDDQIRPFDPRCADGDLTVLYVGRLEKRKGILDLFEAIPRILKQVPKARFVIAGGDNSRSDGFLQDTGMDYASFFKRRYPEFVSHVQLLGAVSDADLKPLYQSCDLFVAPSLYESFGLIYLEAMDFAKPVIGCNAGGVPEVIDQGITGVLVDPGAPTALAEGIVSLLKSPARMREMGLAGRQRLLSQFTYLRMAREFVRVYRQVIRAFDTSHSDE